MNNEMISELVCSPNYTRLAKGLRVLKFFEKKFYAVVNLPCKKIDGRLKRVYTIYTLKKDIHGEIRYIPLR